MTILSTLTRGLKNLLISKCIRHPLVALLIGSFTLFYTIEGAMAATSGWHTQLLNLGITTPLALSRASSKRIRQQLGVVVERIVHELNGVPCIAQEILAPRQQIIVSRSFGKSLTALPDLLAAITHYAVRAFEKLRQQDSFVQQVQVFLAYKSSQGYPLQQKTAVYTFMEPTQDTREALKAVRACIGKLYCSSKVYKKSGVTLLNLTPRSSQINDLFIPPLGHSKAQDIMNVIDQINTKFGRNTLRLAPQLSQSQWTMQAQWCSPGYTSRWSELVLVR